MSTQRRFLLAASGTLALASALAAAPAHAQVAGTVLSPTIEGSAGTPISFSIYLPEGYAGDGSRRYPVVYHLHGLNGSHDAGSGTMGGGGQLVTVPASHEEAVALGLMEPVIIVFPDGYRDAFWSDSFDGQAPAESDVVGAIVPFVDANFDTLATRGQRLIQGFSMGGFGAAKFAAKFPELFGAAVIYDGALLQWNQMLARHPEVASRVFGSDPSYFDEFAPWPWVERNASEIAAEVPFRQVVGALGGFNENFRDHLLANGITPSFIDTPAPHNLSDTLNAADPPGSSSTAGQVSWQFLQAALDGSRETRVSLTSVAFEDGWMRESAETSNSGGARSNAAPHLLAGDTALRQQLRSILSFDTSELPAGAEILSATLTLHRVAAAGSVAALGGLSAEIAPGSFGGPALANADFQTAAAPGAASVAVAVPSENGASSTTELPAAALAAIAGGASRTQIRLSFARDDDDDARADSVSFASGDSADPALRPVLEIVYR